jgi:hypothetical protein
MSSVEHKGELQLARLLRHMESSDFYQLLTTVNLATLESWDALDSLHKHISSVIDLPALLELCNRSEFQRDVYCVGCGDNTFNIETALSPWWAKNTEAAMAGNASKNGPEVNCIGFRIKHPKVDDLSTAPSCGYYRVYLSDKFARQEAVMIKTVEVQAAFVNQFVPQVSLLQMGLNIETREFDQREFVFSRSDSQFFDSREPAFPTWYRAMSGHTAERRQESTVVSLKRQPGFQATSQEELNFVRAIGEFGLYQGVMGKQLANQDASISHQHQAYLSIMDLKRFLSDKLSHPFTLGLKDMAYLDEYLKRLEQTGTPVHSKDVMRRIENIRHWKKMEALLNSKEVNSDV